MRPDPRLIEAACEVLGSGGVVVFPTTSLYGLGADAWNGDAVEKVRRIKRRPEGKPILVLVKDFSAATRLAGRMTDVARRIMERFWPGGVTLVVEASEDVPEYLVSGEGKIGLRVPAHPVARAMVETFGRPVTGTSANVSGGRSCHTVKMAKESIGGGVDLMLDAGPLRGGAGSTVVDASIFPPKILREGSVPAAEVMAAAGFGGANIDNTPSI